MSNAQPPSPDPGSGAGSTTGSPSGSDPFAGGFGAVPLTPLLPDDPPRIGDFWIDARLDASPAGVAYTGHRSGADDPNPAADAGPDARIDTGTGADTPVMVILLSEGAADDPAARDRLAGVVNAMWIDTVLARGGQGQDSGKFARKFSTEDDDPVAPDTRQPAPWVALAYDGSPAAANEARRVLDEVELATLPPNGRPSGPDYRHYWLDRVRPGLARLWPLPWPGRYDRAGWRTILVSWLLMLLLGALAVLIAILIFHNLPPQAPPTPTGSSGSPPPQSSSPSPQSGSPSPQSASPSPQSGSPSPQSGSPSPSNSPSGTPSRSGSPSASASPSPSGTQSGPGQPTPTESGTAGASQSPPSKL